MTIRARPRFTINIDGTGLTAHTEFIGGHPEWKNGHQIIGSKKMRGKGGKRRNAQVVYDVDKKKIVETLGSKKIFPNPGGDVALSPDGTLLANGSGDGRGNRYVVYRLSDGAYARSKRISKGKYSGDIRIDGAPRWNRTNDALLVPGLAEDGTRQMHIIRVRVGE